MGSNLVSGKSPLRISIPIYIFEYRTNLERLAEAFGLAPYYFNKAC